MILFTLLNRPYKETLKPRLFLLDTTYVSQGFSLGLNIRGRSYGFTLFFDAKKSRVFACHRCLAPHDNANFVYCEQCQSCGICGCCPCKRVGCDECDENVYYDPKTKTIVSSLQNLEEMIATYVAWGYTPGLRYGHGNVVEMQWPLDSEFDVTLRQKELI